MIQFHLSLIILFARTVILSLIVVVEEDDDAFDETLASFEF